MREDVYSELAVHLAIPSAYIPELIWINGRASSGKTYVIKKFLHDFNITSIFYKNCDFYPCSKDLLTEICNQDAGRGFDQYNFLNVVRCLRNLSSRITVILDHCDKIFEENPAILTLPRLCGNKLSLVIVSKLQPDCYFEVMKQVPSVHIQLDMYSQADCYEIICNNVLNGTIKIDGVCDLDEAVVKNFINHMIAMHQFNPDLMVMKKLISQGLSLLMVPVRSGQCSFKDWPKLWKLFQPHVKSATSGFSSTTTNLNQSSIFHGSLDSSSENYFEDTLPYDSNVLLVAAYIASYNPPSSDNKFFVKEKQGKNTKLVCRTIGQNKPLCHIYGPKPFPLERLLAICYAIHDLSFGSAESGECRDEIFLGDIMTQITTLVSKQYLAKHGLDVLDNPKFICVANYDFVLKVAKIIDFDLNRHLYDFVAANLSEDFV